MLFFCIEQKIDDKANINNNDDTNSRLRLLEVYIEAQSLQKKMHFRCFLQN